MSKRVNPWSNGLPVLATLLLVLWAWNRLDFFTRTRLVATPDGSIERWPNALATVDHPFHAARFGMMLDALRDGALLRWIFPHQGGYPAEFYPFGSAAVDLLVWMASLGQAGVPMTHTWAVAIVFAMPAIGLLLLTSNAGLSLWAAVFATGVHLCVRGWWWSGGSMELIEWGLITNVLAAALVFLVLICLGGVLDGRSQRWLGVAALLIAWAIWTNPRSAIAVMTVGLAVLAVVPIRRTPDALSTQTPAHRERGRFGWVLAPFLIGAMIAAPLIGSLIRYNDLYFFVHYSGYEGIGDWWDSSIQAVSGPMFVLAIVGLAVVFALPVSRTERLVGWSTVFYVGLTWWLVVVEWPGGWVEQLETTRLMPFQRLLMIALAGIAVGRLATGLAAKWQPVAIGSVAAMIPLLYVIAPPSFLPESDRGLVREGTMAQPGIADLQSAIDAADRMAPGGTALLVLGTTDYWHDGLWAPLWTDRLLYFDDWLWYWQTEHVGDYDPLIEHAYPLDSSALDPDFLRTHGIGAVVVTGQGMPEAAESGDLTQVRSGMHDVYLVDDYRTTVTVADQLASVVIAEERIEVGSLPAQGGTAVIRVNWFPRWTAYVDGDEAPVTHRVDGYMQVDVPPGASEVVLRYQRTVFDWFMVAMSAIGLMAAIGMIARPGRIAWPSPNSLAA